MKGKISVFAISLLLMSSMLVAVGGEAYEDKSEIGEEMFAGGSGTEDDPYLIEDVEQLQNIKEDLSADYQLANDIDASETEEWNDGEGFEPLGMDAPPNFYGSFDGNCHVIEDLHIDRPESSYVGLFGQTGDGGLIEDVGVEGADITGQNHVGVLVGSSLGSVYETYTTGTVEGEWYVGGLTGTNSGEISDSYSFAEVQGDTTAGGLVGWNWEGSIANSYSIGGVTAGTDDGGFVGFNDEGTVSDSFWDTEESGMDDSDGGTGKTTAEMKDVATFTDTGTEGLNEPWDFVGDPNDDEGDEDIWDIDGETNEGYPFLNWETEPDTYELTVGIEGEGAVEVDGEEVEDGWSDDYEEGSDVGLEALPDIGWAFDEWTGDTEGEEEEITVTMDENVSVTANFVEVEEPFFQVEITSPSDGDEFDEDEEVEVGYTVENIGEESGEQDIVFAVDGEQKDVEQDVQLDVGDEHSDSFSWTADPAGSRDLSVASEDDEDEVTIEVVRELEEGPFEVEITDHDEEVEEGDEVDVEYEVSYSGEVPETQDIEFKVDGEVEESEEMTLFGHDYEYMWEHEEHEDWVESVDHAEIDGKDVVFSGGQGEGTGVRPGQVVAYDYEKEEVMWWHEEHEDKVNSVHHAEIDGREVVLSASTDNTVAAYDYHEEELIWSHTEHHTFVMSVRHTEIGGRHVVLSGSGDSSVVAYDYEKEEKIWQHYEHDSFVHSVEYAEIDGRPVVLSGSSDETVVAYDYEGEEVIWRHEKHDNNVNSVHHAEIGGRNMVLSGSIDDTVIAYDYIEEEVIWRHEEHGASVISVDYAEISGRDVVFSASADDTVVAYDHDEEEVIWRHEEHDNNVYSVDHAEIGGKHVVFSGSKDDTVVAVEYITEEVTREGEFTWLTEEGDAGEHEIEVASEDDEDSVFVEVKEPPFFDVEIVDHDQKILDGDEMEVGYEVENTGGLETTQTIEFFVGEDLKGTEEVTLDTDASHESEFTWTAEEPYGERELSVSSEDDTDEVTVEVKEEIKEAQFMIEILDWNDDVAEGDTVSVEYEVENTGEVEGTVSIELRVEKNLMPETVDEEEITLEPGESYSGELSWHTEEGDAGEVEMELITDDDQDQIGITVTEDTDDDDGLLWWILPIVAVVVIVLVLVVFFMKRKGGEEEEEIQAKQRNF